MDDQTTDQENLETQEEVIDSPSTNQANDDVKILLSLEELIKTNIDSTDKLKEELKQHRQMLIDSFENNPTYRDTSEKVKEASKIRAATKQQIIKQPSIINISNKVKSISGEIKERESALSDYLQEYQRMAGVNEIEGLDGEVREIVNTSKLVKRTSRK